ncbi:hypothetical protein [Croceivirga radicis]|uniref:hypothetical protein n=1 Tax=Croceivirga radicis TaxID=1929488 RepID=UPI000255AECE|nr:hypothetical protein [Croceivirga radicis]
MDILKEWRLHHPVLREDKFGNEYFTVPCKILRIGDKKPKHLPRHEDRKVHLEMLNFKTGELDWTEGIMYGVVYERFKKSKATLPHYTYARIQAKKDEFYRIIIYKTSAYVPGILPFLIENYCKRNHISPEFVSDDGLEEFERNYNHIYCWTQSKLNPPESDTFIFDDSNMDNYSNDYYNDQLDMDQQSPEFWDNL